MNVCSWVSKNMQDLPAGCNCVWRRATSRPPFSERKENFRVLSRKGSKSLWKAGCCGFEQAGIEFSLGLHTLPHLHLCPYNLAFVLYSAVSTMPSSAKSARVDIQQTECLRLFSPVILHLQQALAQQPQLALLKLALPQVTSFMLSLPQVARLLLLALS